MRGSVWWKIMVMVAMLLALQVPLWLVGDLVTTREGRKKGVEHEISESSARAQTLAGPLLVVPYVRRVRVAKRENVWLICGAERHEDASAVAAARTACALGKKQPGDGVLVTAEVFEQHERRERRLVAPDALHIDGALATQTVYRGIYAARTYQAALTIKGTLGVDLRDLARDPHVSLGAPWLALGVADVRGLRRAPALRWDGRPLAVQPGNELEVLGPGVHVPLPAFATGTGATVGPVAHAFEVELAVDGTGGLHFLPLGRDTRVTLRADWPHPSFGGAMLPAERAVDEGGFRARWQTSWFATNMDAALRDEDRGRVEAHGFGVDLHEPIHAYQQTLRTLDYDLLFLVSVFAAFFLFELLGRMRIHPLQYLLVGAALATFYLLLIAGAEHLPFVIAYALAAGACSLLCAVYLAAVLGARRRGWLVGAGMAAEYGLLYVVLRSEDYALALGAGLVFALLAAVMVLTRRLDWYAVGRGPQSQ